MLSSESGAGKTTLLNMIGGLEPVDDGSIIVNDIEVTKHKNRMKYYREVVGFLFQNFALVDKKTVRQNLKLVKSGSKNLLTIEDALKRVGLLDKKNSEIVMEILDELNKEGKTVVLVTHVEEYKTAGNRCIKLSNE